jgi:uncharacterized MAPEG superfamily protein
MTEELMNLVWVTALTALLWVPYIVNSMVVRGFNETMGYPENPKPLSRWAENMRAAHYNAVENLVVFAALVLVLHEVGISNDTTVIATEVYFWARIAHVFAYTFSVPRIRTLAFLAGFGCQVALVLQFF